MMQGIKMTKKTIAQIAAPILLAALAGCNTVDRLQTVGRAPPLSPVSNTGAGPGGQPVTMPMPERSEVAATSNSLWRPGSRTFLRDQRAANVGDIITVLVSIQDNAQLQNGTQRSRQNSETMGMPHLFGLDTTLTRIAPKSINPAALIDASSQGSSNGTGSVTRKEAVTLRVAATVGQVLPNGNLVVSGRQEVRVNFERRDLTIAGIIRPQDIGSDNTVVHDRLAEARISYGGNGQITDVQQPRWGQQVIDAVAPF